MKRLSRAFVAMVLVMATVVVGSVAPAGAVGTLTSATFTSNGIAATPAGQQNSRYDWGFTTATSASLKTLGMSVPSGTGCYNPRYLYQDGVTYNFAQTADSTANSITGNIDIRVKESLVSWASGSEQTLLAKWSSGANNRSYILTLNAAGFPIFGWSADGNTTPSAMSTTSTGFSPGATGWLRVTADTNGGGTGTVTFYISTDGTTWNVLGAPVAQTGMSIYNGTQSVTVGEQGDGNAPTSGKIYYAEVRNGINGPVVNKFDPNDDVIGGISWTSSSATAETWTLIRSGSNPTADIACDLTINNLSGVPSGGTATYRTYEGRAVYVIPSATAIGSGVAIAIGLTGFNNQNTPGSFTSSPRTYDNASPPNSVDTATSSSMTFNGGLSSVSYTASGSGYTVPGATNVGYNWGFTPNGTSTPTRVGMTLPAGTTGTNVPYLALNGNSGNELWTPDSAANSTFGDIDIRAQVRLSKWTANGTGNNEIIVDKASTSTNREYEFYVQPSGRLALMTSADGTNWSASATSTVNPSIVPNTPVWLRANRVMDNGASHNLTYFYTSSDGTNWTLLGTSISNVGATSVINGTNNLQIGSEYSGAGAELNGGVYYADVRNGINGTTTSPSGCTTTGVVACFNAADYSSGTSLTSSSTQHEMWNVMRTGASMATDIARDLAVSGTIGVPAGGSATLRSIDNLAMYVFPTGTPIAASTPCTLSLFGFNNTSVAGAYTSSVLFLDNGSTQPVGQSGTSGPLVFAASAGTVVASAMIDPSFTFTVSAHSGACGGVALTGSAAATSVSLGHINSNSAVTAAQDLSTASNSGGNTLIYMRSTGSMSDGNGHTIANMPGTGNAGSPQAFPSVGTAAFGYSLGWLGGQYVPMTTTSQANLTFAGNTQTDCIVYRAQTAPTTPAGAYSATVIYTAVPTF